MSTPVEYASFIIRIWRMTGLDAQGNPYNWQSEVEHIQSGKTWTFDTLEPQAQPPADGTSGKDRQPGSPSGFRIREVNVEERDPNSIVLYFLNQ
jgi:hypothetical protein